jgi:hypothetical protein
MPQTIPVQSSQSNTRILTASPESTKLQECEGDFGQMCDSICTAVKVYGSQNPAILATVVFLVGLYIGWKAKPW